MKRLLSAYHWIGSAYFAIILIASSTAMVVIGTFVESQTESHLYAAYITYNNAFFLLLIFGFFLNILISGMRRWPFKKKHIPFLITHLGLLMILGGISIKNIWGLQGVMAILEGSAEKHIILTNTESLRLEMRDPHDKAHILYEEVDLRNGSEYLFENLKVQLIHYSPHSSNYFQQWIKNDQLSISGLPPFPVRLWDDVKDLETIPFSGQAKLFPNEEQPWHIFALRGTDIAEVSKQIYLQKVKITISDSRTGEKILHVPLEEAIKNPILFLKGQINTELVWDYSTSTGFHLPKVILKYVYQDEVGEISIPLTGGDSLLNENITSPSFGSPPLVIDLLRNPSIALIQDPNNNDFLFIFDTHGQVYGEAFLSSSPNSLYMIDGGYGGYVIQAEKGLSSYRIGREEKEKANRRHLQEQFKQILNPGTDLIPPLQLLYDACIRSHQDFPTVLADFLFEWSKSGCWLYPKGNPLPNSVASAIQQIQWKAIPNEVKISSVLSSLLFSIIEPQIKQGKDLLEILEEIQWPLTTSLAAIPKQGLESLLSLLQEQVISASDQLPPVETDEFFRSISDQAHLFSSLLRSSGIHWSTLIRPAADEDEMQRRLDSLLNLRSTPLLLSTEVGMKHLSAPSKKKWEENIPIATLKFSSGNETEWITLSYDRFGTGLKWPLFKGKYLVRFQPHTEKLPYLVRLRDARQINYPNSSQPYSFEADIAMYDQNGEIVTEKTISMNHVHETWDGYRFYLANIFPPNENAAQRAQIIINADPAKYWLTYPGGIFVSLGIILLFWMQPYSNKRETPRYPKHTVE